MKIVFSRKGFDSTAGGFPSLIFPDGSLFSIPIPGSKDKYVYKDLDFQYSGDSIQVILNDLTRSRINSSKWQQCDYADNKQTCHYDPLPMNVNEFNGIAFGQVQAAEGHLRNQSVGEGDIFLFYGWFKNVEKMEGVWKYIDTAPDVHLIWSYMEVGASVYLDTNEQQKQALNKYPFLKKHPHIGSQGNMKNRVYLSSQHKYFSFENDLCLTDVDNYKGRSTWKLPNYFHQPAAFSFLNNFVLDGDHTIVTYRGYGQEFVLNLDKVKSDSEKSLIEKYISELVGHM